MPNTPPEVMPEVLPKVLTKVLTDTSVLTDGLRDHSEPRESVQDVRAELDAALANLEKRRAAHGLTRDDEAVRAIVEAATRLGAVMQNQAR